MKWKTALKTLSFIKKWYIKDSLNFYEIKENRWRYEYLQPCECGVATCTPETHISVSCFSEEEINMLIRAAATLEMKYKITTA